MDDPRNPAIQPPCHSLVAKNATGEKLKRLLSLADHVFEVTEEVKAKSPSSAHDLANWKRNLADAASIILYVSRDTAGDEPLGLFFAMPRTQPEVGYELPHLWIAAVHPDSRGLGIFPMLMDRLTQHARDYGYREMTVATYPQRFAIMKGVLDKHGWQEVAWLVPNEKVLMKMSL